MDKVHPLVESVARAMVEEYRSRVGVYCQWETLTPSGKSPWLKRANAAIRAVLTFEPTESVISAGFIVHPCASGVSNAYRAMTAALLKEVEGE